MSYQTYTTEAIVCGSYDQQTADRSYRLFTKRAGMVWAHARSARQERSRQRYALQDFARLRVSLVKGKSGWRVGSVLPLKNYYTLAPTQTARGAVVAVTRLLRRLLTGEEPQGPVFADTVLVLEAVARGGTDVATSLELFYLRTLANLGYIGHEPAFAPLLLPSTNWATNPVAITSSARAAIDRGLAASHL